MQFNNTCEVKMVPKRMKAIGTRNGKRNEKITTRNSTQKAHGSNCGYLGEVYAGFATDFTQPTSLKIF